MKIICMLKILMVQDVKKEILLRMMEKNLKEKLKL